MGSIQARLTLDDERRVAQLARKLGWPPSKIVREGLRLLAAAHLDGQRRRVTGVGQFASGQSDLGSNKKHLRGFGR